MGESKGVTSGKSMAVSRLSGCLLLVALVKLTSSEHSGFPTWLSNNLEEFENVAVSWDNASAVPAWLKGTYFKNGPARQDFGGNLRYGNMADGWAKISKFNYLLLLDGESFETLAEARMDTFIPM